MKIQLTVHNLLNQKLRTIVALVGVAFSTILIFMQLGFYGSAAVTATVFIDKLDFDLILLSPDYLDINRPGTFARARMAQANSIDGVESVVPLYVAGNLWRIVDMDDGQPGIMNGRRRGIMVVGFNPEYQPFLIPDMEDQLNDIKVPRQVLIDTETRAYFKQRNVGLATDLGITQVRIVGEFTIGSGYGADGIVLMSDHTYSHVFGGIPLGQVSLGLVKINPESRPDDVAAALHARFQGTGIRVLTRTAMEDKERTYWLNKTAVGKIFSIGVLVALMVGTVFVYQVISSDITQRFAEYATLKAMGYGNSYLAYVVLQQAVLYGVLGYLPGFALSLLLYEWGSAATTLPITMDGQRAAIVLGLSILMCAVSGFFAVKKVRTADPADLF
jgi:putative ABC transport system permease protein